MPDALDMRIIGDFSEYQITNPRLFAMLMGGMEIQPSLDPDAGHGVFQIPIAFQNMKLAPEQVTKLLDIVQGNAYKFYVFVRSWQMVRSSSRPTFIQVIDMQAEPDYCSLCGMLSNNLPNFNDDIVSNAIFP